MAKSAVLKKMDVKQSKKPVKSATKKPVLKVVKNSAPKKTAKKVPAKPVAVKAVKKPVAAAKKPVANAAPKVQKAAPKAAPRVETKLPPIKNPLQTQAKIAAPAPKKEARKAEFAIGHHVVYPTHGVGRIVSEETQMIGEIALTMLVIAFDKDRMTLRVPVNRATAAGLRHISGGDQMAKVFSALKGRARTSRGMWSRRAQEYEAKINSGNIMFIAEVVRDLHPNVDQAERSYSERMIYESALGRLVGELAAAEGTDQKTANDKLLKLLRAKAAA